MVNEVGKFSPDNNYEMDNSSPMNHNTMGVMASYRDTFLGMTPVIGR